MIAWLWLAGRRSGFSGFITNRLRLGAGLALAWLVVYTWK
jgi:hypothetical protein